MRINSVTGTNSIYQISERREALSIALAIPGDKQMPQPNLSAMSVDALLKLRDDINKTLTAKPMNYEVSFRCWADPPFSVEAG